MTIKIHGGNDMSEIAMLREAEPEEILRTAIQRRIPAIMTYLSKGKWHVAKVLVTELQDDRLTIEGIRVGHKAHPINIRIHQPVGISFKYGYGKFVFDTTVVGLEPSLQPGGGGTIALAMPDGVEVIQRRNYFRVEVPEWLKVDVLLWHRSSRTEGERQIRDSTYEGEDYFRGRLVDISAGGAQVQVSCEAERACAVGQGSTGMHKPGIGSFKAGSFRKGQFVGMRFTPMPYERPLMFNAQIRHILPAADRRSIYLGLQVVGLEASPEGRQTLSRLVGVVERYFKINRSSARQDMQPVQNAV